MGEGEELVDLVFVELEHGEGLGVVEPLAAAEHLLAGDFEDVGGRNGGH